MICCSDAGRWFSMRGLGIGAIVSSSFKYFAFFRTPSAQLSAMFRFTHRIQGRSSPDQREGKKLRQHALTINGSQNALHPHTQGHLGHFRYDLCCNRLEDCHTTCEVSTLARITSPSGLFPLCPNIFIFIWLLPPGTRRGS